MPNWSNEEHAVQSTDGGQVTGEKGNTYDTRLVLPVTTTNRVPAQVFAGGSKHRGDRRRHLSREFLQPLKEIVARAGNIGMSKASKAMQQKQRFKQTLSDLRMSFQQFVRLWPDFKVAGNGKDMRITLTTPIQTRTGTLGDVAQ